MVVAVINYYVYLKKAILPESSKITARIFDETVVTKCPSASVTFKSGPKKRLFAETVAVSLNRNLRTTEYFQAKMSTRQHESFSSQLRIFLLTSWSRFHLIILLCALFSDFIWYKKQISYHLKQDVNLYLF